MHGEFDDQDSLVSFSHEAFGRSELADPVLLATLEPPPIPAAFAGAYVSIYVDLTLHDGVRTSPFFPPGALGHRDYVLADPAHSSAAGIELRYAAGAEERCHAPSDRRTCLHLAAKRIGIATAVLVQSFPSDQSDLMKASELQDLLVRTLVRSFGGSPRHWRTVIGPVRLYDLSTHAHCNWSVAPSGGSREIGQVEHLLDTVRLDHPIVTND